MHGTRSRLLVSAALLSLILANAVCAQQRTAGAPGQLVTPREQRQKPDYNNVYDARTLLGKPVQNDQGQSLGILGTLLINRTTGEVNFGVVNAGNGLYAVPWQRFRVLSQDRLQLSVPNRERLSSEFSAFEPDRLPQQNNPGSQVLQPAPTPLQRPELPGNPRSTRQD